MKSGHGAAWAWMMGAVLLLGAGLTFGTALDDYVALPDPSYGYTQYGSSIYDGSPLFGGTGTRAYILELTSQSWRSSAEVTPNVWRHWVTIIVPEWDWLLGNTKDTALILINGGDSTDLAPAVSDEFRLLAAGTRSIIVELTAVPNQPLQFTDETLPRSEDEIIAYSWDKFFTTGDGFWPVQGAMVKSVTACMDAVQEFVDANTSEQANAFVLTGGSKRGWTAWLTAAVDMRVTAVAPIVSDLLNMKRSFAHHWAAYGFWADALSPYEDMGIFDWFDTAEADALMEIVDPYSYRDRLDLPKFIINAAGDDFFVNDSVQFYLHGLSGETYLRHVPNADHYLTNLETDVLESMAPFYDAFLNGQARPAFDWTLEPDGSIVVHTTDMPKQVLLWQASNAASRDFRLTTTGAVWSSTALTDQGGGVYVGQVPVPEEGWTAYFVEVRYESAFQGAGQYDFRFTTEMVVLPEVLPFETDFSRDTFTTLEDVFIFAESWLDANAYRDIYPRRGGDDLVNLQDFSLFGLHWLE